MSNNILKDLEPKEVYKYFAEICDIPRGTGNEKGISDYLVNFAKSHNLEVIQDKALNVIIRKDAAPGYENAPTVILQGHMDMVCEKNSDTVHDFEKDPLKLKIDGDLIKAEGTTLGADNGIAIAFALAILDSKYIAHPKLEVIITTGEEAGLDGATALDGKNISGRVLINIDSEEEGRLLVSCAGGVRNSVSLEVKREVIDKDEVFCALRIRGLKGGHSGMEIDKGRGNSNKLMGRILMDLYKKYQIKISSLNGGAKHNAIPREMDAVIAVKKEEISTIQKGIESWSKTLSNEFTTSDKDLRIEFEVLNDTNYKVFTKDTTEKALKLLYLIPNGVRTMSMDISNLVESSSNLGVVTTYEDKINFDSSIRSSIASIKEQILDETKVIAEMLGAGITTSGGYPEWQYDKNSKLRSLFQKIYEELYGKEPEIVAIHAGVECGVFKDKLGEGDMISFGPNLYDVHTPEEAMSISSVERTYAYLLEVLAEIKNPW